MNIWLIIIIAVVLIGVVVLLIVSGSKRFDSDQDPLAARLAEFSARGTPVTLEEIELSQPFQDRVLLPIMKRLGDLSSRFTPQNALDSTTKKLELAGNPGNLGAASFLSLRFVGAGVLGGLLFLIFIFSNTWPISREILITIGFTVFGFFFPQIWLQSKINKRQKEIRKALPDALDLLTICVEAGLGFDAAMSKVGEKWENELSMAFARVIREIQLGKLRREAMKDMAERIGIPEMTSFVAAIIQTEVLGVSMARVLRIQADQMRLKRRQRAEEEAQKAPIKMILPMGVFIFPSILIVLLTPAMMRISSAFGSL